MKQLIMSDLIPSLRSPVKLALIIMLMNKELRLSTIKATSGLSMQDTVKAVEVLIDRGIIELFSINTSNPIYRLVNPNLAKELLLSCLPRASI